MGNIVKNTRHKHILAAASPALEAMVENIYREAIECKANIELSEEAGRAFVQFIYIGELNDHSMKEHASALLAMGELYDVQELKGQAEAELVGQMSKENMVQMISLAELYRAQALLDAAVKMAKANMTWLLGQVIR